MLTRPNFNVAAYGMAPMTMYVGNGINSFMTLEILAGKIISNSRRS